MSSKLSRQNKIKELLQTHVVCSQEELVELLKKESIDITQATLSRDFGELGVIRTRTDQGMRYMINIAESGLRVAKLIGYEIVNMTHNESLIVVRTLAGRANGVAQYIDRAGRSEILGTLAGDDTVLIIPDSQKNINTILDYLRDLSEDTE